MSTVDYSAKATLALRLITKFGAEATVKRKTNGSYNPTTSKATAGGVAEKAQAVTLPYAPYVVNNSGGSIRQEDQQMLVAPEGLGADPEPQDQITLGNAIFTIVSVNALKPDGATAVLYTLQVRR